jgi:ABC-type branched-subunit amino acid transport system substrate-binding protein
MAEAMLVSGEVAYKRIKLLRWNLNGSPESWQGQLQEYYDREPVFALLGGISSGPWQPIHDFCEKKGLPSILPITDLPVISDKDWYTLYFSKGPFQEGEAAAKYLNRALSNVNGGILQLTVGSSRSQLLAKGFSQTWLELRGNMPKELQLDSGKAVQQLADKSFVSGMAAVLIWLEPEEAKLALKLLETFQGPVFLPGGEVDFSSLELSDAQRERIFFTYPYRLPVDEKKYDAYTDQIFINSPKDTRSKKIIKQVYSINQVLNQALMELKGDYYRDALLDVLGMGMGGGMGVVLDTAFPLYERLSFGPNQRYASKGCYVVQLPKGPSLHPVLKSEWVIH